MRFCNYLGAAVLFATALPLSGALAATSTATMNVGITVTSGCNISVTDISFGSVQATALASALTSTSGGVVSFTCGTTTTTPALTANQGANYSGSNRMKGSLGGFIPYSLNLPSVPSFTGSAQTVQVTATIPAQTTLPGVDSYTDQVVLTLTY